MAPTVLCEVDRKISRSSGLPAFLQRKIQFKEASTEDRPNIVSYSQKTSKSPSQVNRDCLFDASRLPVEWQSVGRVGGGLRNIGNTCFLNSVLQCLHYTAPLHNLLVFGEHQKRCLCQAEHCMLCELAGLFKNMAKGSMCTPSTIVSRLKGIARHMKPGRQEDAHEFLRYFVDALQRSALFGLPNDIPTKLKETTAVHAIFGGRLRSCITCAHCHHRSLTCDPFLDISLEVKQTDSVEGAFTHFTRVESLSRGNRYKCEACGQLTEASKQMTINQLPNVLTVHLKRFAPGMDGVSKIHKHISFDHELDVKPYVSEGVSIVNTKYSLYGVLVHDGHSTHSGHYYSFIKSSNSFWYCMNDESVTQVSLATVLKQRAYLLFYQQQPPTNPIHPSTKLEEDYINVEDCSSTTSQPGIARSNSMWHMTTSPSGGKHREEARERAIKKWNVSKLSH